MIKTPAYLVPDAFTETERLALLDYLDQDDDRTDDRPDVRSKHPNWNQPGWPQHIVADVMDRVLGKKYNIEEVVFRQDKVSLKIHTDYGSPEGYQGKTMIFLLDAKPEAQTIFFKNYFTVWTRWGAFFTKTPWNRFAYTLTNKHGDLQQIEDLRDFLTQCESSPGSVENFDVTEEFLAKIRHLIHKRTLPKLEPGVQDQTTGYMQAGLRLDDYSVLTDYDPDARFDPEIHRRFLSDTPIQDLNGLAVESVQHWQVGGVLIFDREQLHSSSNCHQQKSFITIFYHIID
jgi:hypothetical protein